MKKFAALMLLLLCPTSFIHAQKIRLGQVPANAADYPVKVHISASHYSLGSLDQLFADATVNGKKFELSGGFVVDRVSPALLTPGDYQAKLTKNKHNADSTVIHQEYDLLLPDGAVWHCITSGISE